MERDDVGEALETSTPLEFSNWSVLLPHWVSFSIRKMRSKKHTPIAMLFFSPLGATKPECLGMPVGGVFDTAQDAFDWIEEFGVNLFPCPVAMIVAVTGDDGEVQTSWKIQRFDDEE